MVKSRARAPTPTLKPARSSSRRRRVDVVKFGRELGPRRRRCRRRRGAGSHCRHACSVEQDIYRASLTTLMATAGLSALTPAAAFNRSCSASDASASSSSLNHACWRSLSGCVGASSRACSSSSKRARSSSIASPDLRSTCRRILRSTESEFATCCFVKCGLSKGARGRCVRDD